MSPDGTHVLNDLPAPAAARDAWEQHYQKSVVGRALLEGSIPLSALTAGR